MTPDEERRLKLRIMVSQAALRHGVPLKTHSLSWVQKMRGDEATGWMGWGGS